MCTWIPISTPQWPRPKGSLAQHRKGTLEAGARSQHPLCRCAMTHACCGPPAPGAAGQEWGPLAQKGGRCYSRVAVERAWCPPRTPLPFLHFSTRAVSGFLYFLEPFPGRKEKPIPHHTHTQVAAPGQCSPPKGPQQHSLGPVR